MLYTIVQDSNRYRSLVWDDAQITQLVGESDMELRIDMWNSPRTYKDVFDEILRVSFKPLSKQSEKLAIPDVSVLQGRLFLSSKAHSVLSNLIKPDGEFLKVNFDGEDGYIFTPLCVAEKLGGLDIQLSRKNEWGDVESLSFHEEKVKGCALFRCEYDMFMSLHCQQVVKDAIEKGGLKGVFFTTDLGNIFSNQFDGNIRDTN